MAPLSPHVLPPRVVQERLAARFAPVVWLSDGEEYYPSSVDAYLVRCELWKGGQRVLGEGQVTNAALLSAFREHVTRNVDVRASDGGRQVRPAREYRLRCDPAFHGGVNRSELDRTPCYAHVRAARLDSVNTLAIVYSYFYPYNGCYTVPPCARGYLMGGHEADWEHCTVHLRRRADAPPQHTHRDGDGFDDRAPLTENAHTGGDDGTPVPRGDGEGDGGVDAAVGAYELHAVWCNAHRERDGTLVPASKLQRYDGSDRVVLYIARNGHGTYPHAGTWRRLFCVANDHCSRGALWVPPAVLLPGDPSDAAAVAASPHAWVAYPGRWGTTFGEGHASAQELAAPHRVKAPGGCPCGPYFQDWWWAEPTKTRSAVKRVLMHWAK